jgi:Rod binding domain-containing protein
VTFGVRPHQEASAPSPVAVKAAREFESLLVGQMLKSLERTGRVAGTPGAGQQIYGSMIVEAVSDAITRAGGMGLTDLIARTLEGSGSVGPTKSGT